MANTPEEFPVFTKLSHRQISLLNAKFKLYLRDFEFNCGITDIHTSDTVVTEIRERIEKRRVYFHIFYDRCKLGELNEGSLMCFWINKLMPFYHKDIPANQLNAKIAVYIFDNMVLYYAKKNNKKTNLSHSFDQYLYYALRFRDLSKEAIMALAESVLVKQP